MFQSIRNAYGALGVMLFLIALYLVLENAGGASRIIGAGSAAGVTLFRTLQGR